MLISVHLKATGLRADSLDRTTDEVNNLALFVDAANATFAGTFRSIFKCLAYDISASNFLKYLKGDNAYSLN